MYDVVCLWEYNYVENRWDIYTSYAVDDDGYNVTPVTNVLTQKRSKYIVDNWMCSEHKIKEGRAATFWSFHWGVDLIDFNSPHELKGICIPTLIKNENWVNILTDGYTFAERTLDEVSKLLNITLKGS